jgi:heat shock protein HtpX
MNLWKLKLSMLGTVAFIIGISTLGFTLILSAIGSLNLYSLVFIVGLFNIGQWLFAPYLVNAIYKIKELEEPDNPILYARVKELSRKSGIKTPKIMMSQLPIPNAFAYGSPITGNHVALTKGLLQELETDEIDAVIGHELGHLKHKDTQIMMMASLLPSLFYILARSFLYSSYYRGRNKNNSGMALIGGASMLIYFVLLLFNLNLSRLREYYADQHSSSIIDNGAKKLSHALSKISAASWRIQNNTRGKLPLSNFKALFITDPDSAEHDVALLHTAKFRDTDDALVNDILGRRITFTDKIMELFSSHPNIVKRLRALNAIA